MKYLLIMGFIIQGCVTQPITLPDGTQGYAVECRNNEAVCLRRASKLCPQGYDVLETTNNGYAKASSFGAHVDMNTTKMIRCTSH
jgi:hypothetical protein